jgi:hypothetical protein
MLKHRRDQTGTPQPLHLSHCHNSETMQETQEQRYIQLLHTNCSHCTTVVINTNFHREATSDLGPESP